MKNILIVLSSFFLTTTVFASDVGLELGFRQQSGDATGGSTTSQSGYHFGGVGTFDLSGPLMLRAGFEYVQRPLSVTVSAVESKYTMNYFDVPVGLLYKFTDYGGVFAGVSIANRLDGSCTTTSGTCTVTNPKSMLMPFQLGVSFKFAPQLGIILLYENMSGDVAQGLSNYRAVGANLLVTFD